MRRVAADLHIHTALSPCAEEEMTPPAILRRAALVGLGMIAICDHNAADNAAAAQEAAGGKIAVLAGMEITTAEEAHVLGLFPDAASACAAGREVKATLPDLRAGPGGLGRQWLTDARGHTVGGETKMLSAASGLALGAAVALIRRHRGVAIAAHADRPSFSVLSQLGVWPDEPTFDAVEVSATAVAGGRAQEYAALGLPVVTSSDAHFLSAIGSCFSSLEMCEPTLDGLAQALRRPIGLRCADA